jgi:NADH:ubiquinone oxidoreductase subunit 3 (subunit A)
MDITSASWFYPVIIILVIWDIIWKLVAMWYASRNNHLAWYIVLAIINSVGILPILYLFVIRKSVKKS